MTGGRGKYIRLPQLRTCERCGQSYQTKSPKGRYCNKACKQAAYRLRKAAAV